MGAAFREGAISLPNSTIDAFVIMIFMLEKIAWKNIP
jgi:hypothetical protein